MNNNDLFKTSRDLKMYFQTTIRNIALTTTVSFAALSYSRYYFGKNNIFTIGMCIVSLLFLVISFNINHYLYNRLQIYKKLENFESITQLDYINIIFFTIHIITIIFVLYTLYRLILFKKYI